MAVYDIDWNAVLVATTDAVVVGTVLVRQQSDGLYIIATAANRATNGRADGLALTAGDQFNRGVEMLVTGWASPAQTNLGAGTASWVRVSTTGFLERCTPSGSDDIVGFCKADGSMHIMLGFLTAAITAATGGTPSAPNLSVQFDNGGAFGGAANVAIAGGDLCVGVGLTGSMATSGQIRSKFGTRWMSRSWSNLSDVTILSHDFEGDPVSPGPDELSIGGNFDEGASTVNTISLFSKAGIGWAVGPLGSFEPSSLSVAYRDDLTIPVVETRVENGGNFGIVATLGSYGGGSGVFFLRNAATVPSSNPTAGVIFYTDAADGFAKIRMADGTIVILKNATPFTPPTGTGPVKVSGGVLVAAATKINLADTTNDVTGVLPRANMTAPTGTGFASVTAGAWDVASIKADLGNSTYVTVPGSDTYVLYRGSGVVAANSSFTHDGSGNVAVSTSLAAGGTPATAGTFRIPNAGTIQGRDAGNTVNYVLMKNVGGGLYLGSDDALANYVPVTNIWARDSIAMGNNADGYYVSMGSAVMAVCLNGQTLASGGPIIGRSASNSPYGAHGEVVVAGPNSGTTTLAASEYSKQLIQIGSALGAGTAGTATGNVDFPVVASGAGVWKWVYNGCQIGTTSTLRKAGGGGRNTVGPAVGKIAGFWISSTDVYRMTPDQTP